MDAYPTHSILEWGKGEPSALVGHSLQITNQIGSIPAYLIGMSLHHQVVYLCSLSIEYRTIFAYCLYR